MNVVQTAKMIAFETLRGLCLQGPGIVSKDASNKCLDHMPPPTPKSVDFLSGSWSDSERGPVLVRHLVVLHWSMSSG